MNELMVCRNGGAVIGAVAPIADLNKFNPSSSAPFSFDSQSSEPDSTEFEIHRKNFTVKIANTRREILQAYRLRYEVFQREFRGVAFPLGVDTDRYDRKAQLLIIIDNHIKRVVGTYRLINSRKSQDFYSASEFQLDSFLRNSSTKVELSRACVHKDYRNGTVVHLLWRGLAEYINLMGADYLFGCSSVKTTNLSHLQALYKHLSAINAIDNKYQIEPTPKYRLKEFESWKKNHLDTAENGLELSDAQLSLPPLFRSYLKAGAKVALEPALDKKYGCFDFLTILNVEDLTKGYVRKYSVS